MLYLTFARQPRQSVMEEILKQTIYIPEHARGWSLSQLTFPVRLRRVLARKGFTLVGQLHGKTYSDILAERNCGKKTIEELRNLVSELQAGILPDNALQHNSLVTDDHDVFLSDVVAIPEQYRALKLGQISFSVRLHNVLSKIGCLRLGDIHGIKYADIKKQKSCGKNTINELKNFVVGLQANNQIDVAARAKEFGAPYLVKFVDEFIATLKERERHILLLRYGGLNESPSTLEEIGIIYSVTRERIRQIIDKTLRQLHVRGGDWMNGSLLLVAAKCAESFCPLMPQVFQLWFETNARQPEFAAAFYIRLFVELEPSIPAWPTGKQASPIATFNVLRPIRELLKKDAMPLRPLKEIYAQAKQADPGWDVSVEEILNALHEDRAIVAEFVEPESINVRIRKLRTLDWVRLILSRSDRPLTPEEILERASEQLGDTFNPRSPFSIANVLSPEDGFYRLDKSAFGLREHMRLPQNLWPKLKDDFYQLLKSRNRPVSTPDVFNNSLFDWTKDTTAAEAAQILREDNRFTDLGRFHFALAEWGVEEREYIAHLIPKVLTQSEHPLSASEIVERLQSIRSITPTAMSSVLRKHKNVSEYGFGYYGLKSWGDAAREFLVSQKRWVNRVIMRSGPPLSFERLCDIVGIPMMGHLADRLWRTVWSLPKVRTQPNEQSLQTLLIHKSWSLERALYAIMSESEHPMRGYEIQWELNKRFSEAFSEKSLPEIENALRNNRLFVRNTQGEFLLAQQLEDYNFDDDAIRQACYEILSDNNQILGVDELFDRLEEEVVEVENLSADILSAMLRDSELFEEIGRNRFRVKK